VRIIRIFNTFGRRMRQADGRAVPTFIKQAVAGQPLTVHGEGAQTRSLCYVDDLIEGIWRLLNADVTGPMNIGNPQEIKILDLARMIIDSADSNSEITFIDRPVDDPEVRCPDISMAGKVLGWEPKVSLEEGLQRTIEWARESWSHQ
jgi:dTDP-glucose 4,6-dehydratase